jgi:hypothetical protein
MTADIQGECLSVLSDYKPSVGCLRSAPDGAVGTVTTDLTYFGSRTTAAILTISPSHPVVSQTLTSVDPADFDGISVMPMAILVHRSEDTSPSTTGSAGASPTGSGGGGGSGNSPSKPNAATPGRLRGRGDQIALLVSVGTVAVGAAFVLAL